MRKNKLITERFTIDGRRVSTQIVEVLTDNSKVTYGIMRSTAGDFPVALFKKPPDRKTAEKFKNCFSFAKVRGIMNWNFPLEDCWMLSTHTKLSISFVSWVSLTKAPMSLKSVRKFWRLHNGEQK